MIAQDALQVAYRVTFCTVIKTRITSWIKPRDDYRVVSPFSLNLSDVSYHSYEHVLFGFVIAAMISNPLHAMLVAFSISLAEYLSFQYLIATD
jgi:hypothetical protein